MVWLLIVNLTDRLLHLGVIAVEQRLVEELPLDVVFLKNLFHFVQDVLEYPPAVSVHYELILLYILGTSALLPELFYYLSEVEIGLDFLEDLQNLLF